MQRDIVGCVGAHTCNLLIRHLIAVQRQNHSISYFQWTSQRTFTGQQLLIITCHMHNIVVLRRHLRRMDDVEDRTNGVVKVLEDVSPTEYIYLRMLRMLIQSPLKLFYQRL